MSNLGNVRSLDRYVRTSGNPSMQRFVKGRIITQTCRNSRNAPGYLYVNLSKNNKDKLYAVHRLVAKAFIPNPDNLEFVNHKDECKHNNNVENLEWCTATYNNNYGTARERANAKKEKAILKFSLNGDLLCKYSGVGTASKTENVSKGNLANVCVNRNSKKTLNGFVFMYEDDYNAKGFVGYKNTRLKAVNQYDINGRFIRGFESIKEAAKTIPSISKNGEANITAVCRGRQKSAYGYIWKYPDEEQSIVV